MSQKQITNYMPHVRKPKKELDTWTIECVFVGQRKVWNPDYDQENPDFKDCTEVEICNQRTGEVVTFRDEVGMMEFWEECKGFSFEWKGGKRIQRKRVLKELIKSGYFKITNRS